MDANEARQISSVVRDRDKVSQEQAIADLRNHRKFSPDLYERKCDLEAALNEVSHAASHGSRMRYVHLSLATKVIGIEHFASLFGRAEALAKTLTGRGFKCTVGRPYPTHDLDGHNGVTCSVTVEW